ncbi:MAG: NUDIX domain-containing protein [Acidobacteriota bacterium]
MAESAPRIVRIGVGVVIARRDLVLVGRRRGAHGGGTWALPGGNLEFGESPQTCARREVLEETGLVVDDIIHAAFTHDVFDDGQHYVTLFVQAGRFTGEPRNLEPDKCDGWEWRPWDALPEPLFVPLANLRAQGFVPRPGD